MILTKNSYILLGLVLILFGAALSLISHIILESVPLTALGLSSFILGAICAALGKTRPNLSPEAAALLLETGIENTAVIVEELGLSANAIYIPSSRTGEGGGAVIPIAPRDDIRVASKVPRRLITNYGGGAGDIGIMVVTTGRACLRMLKEKPGPTASEMEAAVTSFVCGMLDAADKAQVNLGGDRVSVEIINPRLKYRNVKFYRCTGSPLASIAATLVCEALDKPLVIEAEKRVKGKTIIELRVLH